jgi:hypothetical protein
MEQAMAWIKISDEDGGIYAREPEPDPAVIVSVAEIEAEIKELQARIDSVRLIEIPKDASEEVVIAIEKSNEFPRGEIVMFETRLKDKQNLLNELKAL